MAARLNGCSSIPGHGLQILMPPVGSGDHNAQGKRPSSKSGFTLLEVIVALAILGIGFSLSMELLGTGMRSARASGDYTKATLLARQKMAELSAMSPLEPSADGGALEGGFRWASEIQPVPGQAEALPARLYQLRVRVTWPGRAGDRYLDLSTLRVAVDETKLPQTRAVQPQGGLRAGEGPR